MENHDTISLLRECRSGAQMGVYSIDEILEQVKDQKLHELLASSKEHHTELGNRIHIQLNKCGDPTKEPGAIAKGMSWMKTNAKLLMDDSDKTCAGLIVDGCHMGAKTIQGYLNEYKAADKEARQSAEELIRIEEKLADDLKPYL